MYYNEVFFDASIKNNFENASSSGISYWWDFLICRGTKASKTTQWWKTRYRRSKARIWSEKMLLGGKSSYAYLKRDPRHCCWYPPRGWLEVWRLLSFFLLFLWSKQFCVLFKGRNRLKSGDGCVENEWSAAKASSWIFWFKWRKWNRWRWFFLIKWYNFFRRKREKKDVSLWSIISSKMYRLL